MARSERRRFFSSRRKSHCERKRPLLTLELLESRTFLSGSQIILGPPTDLTEYTGGPTVTVDLRNGTQDLGPNGTDSTGLFPYNQFLLDTGSNSITVVSDAAQELLDNGLQNVGTYSDLGIAGSTPFNISAPYQLNFSGTDGVTHTLPQTSQDVRIESNANFEFDAAASEGGVPGVLGMPAMVGRVTTLDTSPLANLEPLGVTFSDTLPAGNGHRYTVATDTRVTFDPRDGLPPGSPPDAPIPTWANVTFVTATLEYQGVSKTGSFLVDTGAQMSVMSPELATSLGLNLNDPIETVPVAGVGGTVNLPVLAVDKLGLATEQGPQLVWQGTSDEPLGLLVEDIAPGIDGVIGSDLLAGGQSLDLDSFDVTGTPYFDTINLDFRNLATQGTGQIDFNLNPQYDTNVRTWIAAAGGNWSTATNWSGGVTPQSGDMVVLQSASPATLVNDLPAGQTLGAIFANGDLAISGNSVVLDAAGGTAIGNVAGDSTLGIQSQLASDGTVQVTAGQLTISGGLATNGHQLSVDVASGATGFITGAITGTGELEKLDSGTLALSGANSYSGGTAIAAGTLIVTDSQSIADGTSLTVGAGGTFVFNPSAATSPIAASPAPTSASPSATMAVADTALRTSTPDVVLPSHVAVPTLLPPEARKLDPSPAVAAEPSLSKSSAVSPSAFAVLPPAAADAVLAAGISLPIPYAMNFWAATADGTANSVDSTQEGTSLDATLLTRMTVLRG
ncbi:MAG: aspartyl protease family protein [Thermoguttaceae bacterium]